ncbi:DUF3093 domain-containing protein [Rhodococcus sp. NPDC058521]|uniref:DUF3093 domain-containing protein n=1 Tax=Rhodococcus sp. NPDC058521 TaxID=3346536 RepID=UPI00365BF35C
MPHFPDPDVVPSDQPSANGSSTVFAERLWVPIWWWVAALFVAGLLAAELHMGAPGVRAWLPYLLVLPIPIWAMFWMSRLRVEVIDEKDGRHLRVGEAHLPVDVIARAAEVPASAKSAALGRQLDPAAFVQHRAWVKTMILVVLDDPDDPTPYWLVSTRRPAKLLAAIDGARSPE